MCAQVFFRYSGFLPQSRNRRVRLTGDSKLPSGMNEWYVHPAMDGWPVLREQKTKTNGWVDRINAVTSSLADCSSEFCVCKLIWFRANKVWMFKWSRCCTGYVAVLGQLLVPLLTLIIYAAPALHTDVQSLNLFSQLWCFSMSSLALLTVQGWFCVYFCFVYHCYIFICYTFLRQNHSLVY